MICPGACHAAAAAVVVYTGLRKEPCEPGGNCVKSPCELLVRWLADRWVCMPRAKEREGGRRTARMGGCRREKKKIEKKEGVQKGLVSESKLAGSGLHVRGRLSSCGGRMLSAKQSRREGGAGGGGGRGCRWVMGHFRSDVTSINKGSVYERRRLQSLTCCDFLSLCDMTLYLRHKPLFFNAMRHPEGYFINSIKRP